MPRRLSPLPRSRLRQGARRMEPDGALLQLHPRAQHPRLRGLRGLHGKAIPVALTRPYGRFKLHPAPSGNVLDKYAGLAPDQTLRPQPCRVINTTCPVSTGKSRHRRGPPPTLKKYAFFLPPHTSSPSPAPPPTPAVRASRPLRA